MLHPQPLVNSYDTRYKALCGILQHDDGNTGSMYFDQILAWTVAVCIVIRVQCDAGVVGGCTQQRFGMFAKARWVVTFRITLVKTATGFASNWREGKRHFLWCTEHLLVREAVRVYVS